LKKKRKEGEGDGLCRFAEREEERAAMSSLCYLGGKTILDSGKRED